MWTRRIVVAMIVTSFAGVGCAAPSTKAASEEAKTLVSRGNNAFAIALYQELQSQPGNLFFSPYSFSTSLAMTHAGARGATQEQMAQTLFYPTSAQTMQKLGLTQEPLTQEQFDKAFGQIIKDLNKQGKRNKNELCVANALWGQMDYKFQRSFIGTVKRQYAGEFQEVDFITATEKARQAINTWVTKKTNNLVKELISQGVLDAATRMVLTNAIYFKGQWAAPFAKEQTQEEPFLLSDGGKVQVPTMNQKAKFDYAQTDTMQVLEMPYAGQELSMVILLPKEMNGIGRVEKHLTAENLAQWLSQTRRQEVIVTVPRFKMGSRFRMEETLQAMGMTEAFSRDADFSGMTGQRELFLSAVIHQAYVEVNEEGTEAAAATGVVMKLTSAMPGQTPVFRADHPFLFLIRDKASGSILFLGRMMSPHS